jgi:hypothetical protein
MFLSRLFRRLHIFAIHTLLIFLSSIKGGDLRFPPFASPQQNLMNDVFRFVLTRQMSEISIIL